MAIFINEDKLTTIPSREFIKGKKEYSLRELEEFVGGSIEPIKIGPIWIIFNADLQKNIEYIHYEERPAINTIITKLLKKNIYGQVIAISAHELPLDWDLLEGIESEYSATELDAGFIKFLEDIGITEHQNVDWTYNRTDHMYNVKKIEYTYDPKKSDEEIQNIGLDDFHQFLRDCSNHILNRKLSNDIIYEDDINIVKVKPEDTKQTLTQILKILESDEEYEKCAVIAKIMKKKND
jgi:hypothetical protein